MNWADPFFITLILIGPSFILAGGILYKWPPKKINKFFGYRTKRSRKSKEIWDYAQRHSAIETIKLGLIAMTLSLAGLFWHLNEHISLVLGIVTVIGMTIMLFIRTENALRKRFD